MILAIERAKREAVLANLIPERWAPDEGHFRRVPRGQATAYEAADRAGTHDADS